MNHEVHQRMIAEPLLSVVRWLAAEHRDSVAGPSAVLSHLGRLVQWQMD